MNFNLSNPRPKVFFRFTSLIAIGLMAGLQTSCGVKDVPHVDRGHHPLLKRYLDRPSAQELHQESQAAQRTDTAP